MTRLTDADHNDALLSTSRQDKMGTLTGSVRQDANACDDTEGASCFWVPRGSALVPEKLDYDAGTSKWITAF